MNLRIFSQFHLTFVTAFWIATGLRTTKGEEGLTGVNEPITFQWCSNKPKITNSVAFEIPESLSEGRIKFLIRFKPGSISCPVGVKARTLSLSLKKPFSSNHPPHLSSAGFFRFGNYYYPPDEFCFASWTKSSIAVMVCGESTDTISKKSSESWSFPKCDNSNHCIPKCCPMHMLLTSSSANEEPECQQRFHNSARVNPILYTHDLQKSSSQKPVYYIIKSITTKVVPEAALVKTDTAPKKILHFNKYCFRVVEDGTLFYLENFEWIQVPQTNYCIDGIQVRGTPLKYPQLFLGQEDQYGVFLNDSSKRTNTESFPPWLAAISMSASIFFIMTLAVYVLLWEEQKLQGWIAMSEFATMFLSHFVSGLLFIFSEETKTRSFACIAIGFVAHFLYLSQYCWLTVICFNLFNTFRKITFTVGDENNLGSYMRHAGFGWGVPFLFVSVSLILDQIYSYDPCNQLVVPQYGVESCTVSSAALSPYLLYPLALLLSVNTILFSMTSYKLYTYSKSAKIAMKNFQDGKNFFKLIARLFFVTGITWIIYFAFNVLWKYGLGSVPGFWETLSVLIYFQALAVFIIYTCKPSISASLRERYPILIPILNIPAVIKSSLYCKESKPLELSSMEAPNKEMEKLMPEITRE